MTQPLLANKISTSIYFRILRGYKHSAVLHSAGPIPWWGPEITNGREVVCDASGTEIYAERLDYYFPATRFRRNDELILPIREKELDDWKNLTLEEKKLLYRYSFRQTLAEYQARKGYWKLIASVLLFTSSIALAYFTFVNTILLPELPITMIPENREREMEKLLVLGKGSIDGPATKYDYENNRWKV